MWVKEIASLAEQPPLAILNWLIKPYILSHALRRVCQQLTVKVLAQKFMPVDEDEQKIAGISSATHPFVRQVFLQGDNVPWVYARVIVPPVTYDHHFSEFEKLGSQLLGETMLYNNPSVKRDSFEYCHFEIDHPFFQEIKMQGGDISDSRIWGRRSVFWLKTDPLLVTELFLPTLPLYVAGA